MDWDLSTRERWEAARSRGRLGWVLRSLVSPVLASFAAFAAMYPTRVGQDWWEALLTILVLAVVLTAYVLTTVYDAAAAKFADTDA